MAGNSITDVLDCAGHTFSKSWDRLHGLVQKQDAAPLTTETVALASSLIARNRNRSADGCTLLRKVLIGEAQFRELNGFCAYGYCAALLVAFVGTPADSANAKAGRLRNYEAKPDSRRREKKEPVDPAKADPAVKPGADWLIEEAIECASWAGDWWGFDFLRDSRWSSIVTVESLLRQQQRDTADPLPLRSQEGKRLAIELSSDNYLTPYKEQMAEVLRHFLPPIEAEAAMPSLSEHPKRFMQVPLPRASAELSRRWAAEGNAPILSNVPRVNIAAFGVHLTTLLECISAFRVVLTEKLDVVSVLYGASHPPPETIVREACPGDVMEGDVVPPFRCLISTTPGDAFWQSIVERKQMKTAMDELAAVLHNDLFIRRTDMLVCGGGHSPTLCLLLRMVTDIPMYFNIQAPITFRMPKVPDQRALLVAFFRELTKPPAQGGLRGRTVVSTSLIFFQRQYWVQTGRLLPVVRNHNWYAGMVPSVLEGDAGKFWDRDEVMFWQNHVSLKPDCAVTVYRFMKQNVPDETFPLNIVFKNIAQMPTKRATRRVYALRAEESIRLSYGEMRRRFLAAVLFPHDLGMISFDDLYAAGLPIYMPSPHLIATLAYGHLADGRNYPWYLIRDEHADLHYARADAESGLPWDPSWGGKAALATAEGTATYVGRGLLDLNKLAKAVEVSNYVLFPHVRRFDSLSALLADFLRPALKDDLAATTTAMAKSKADAWAVTGQFYRRAAAYLLQPEKLRAD
eukprot:TRINITY_DN51029_c0_g1_i1.p1 TRINITY_DN51029_c0_g1~~TRINITY_DN51029_c0_g1_i1.p1  ORF type:complete len:742 (-),score=113.09 TRINITY_DN51029_c0_g1_i1:46-2271(-)